MGKNGSYLRSLGQHMVVGGLYWLYLQLVKIFFLSPFQVLVVKFPGKDYFILLWIVVPMSNLDDYVDDVLLSGF